MPPYFYKPGQVIFDNTGKAVGIADADGNILPLSRSTIKTGDLLEGADYAMYDAEGNLISKTRGDQRGYKSPFQNWEHRNIDMGQDWSGPDMLDIEDGKIDEAEVKDEVFELEESDESPKWGEVEGTFLICPRCGAAVPATTREKHENWHRTYICDWE